MANKKTKVILITELKGVYEANYNDDLQPTKIKSILQDVETGEFYFNTDEYGLIETGADFVGSLEELKKLQKEAATKG